MMPEFLTLPFMQRALLAGIMAGFLGSYYGVFIVQRGLSFLGSGLSHAAFGGVALGLLLGAEPLYIAVPFTILVSLLITFVSRRTAIGVDTSIGIFFSVSMALGIVFLSLREEYSSEAMTYLFGSILAVEPRDLYATGALVLASLATLPIWGRWAYVTFDRELAAAAQLPISRDDYILSALIAVTVVVTVKVLGIVLMAAFLVLPAATARIWAGTFFQMATLAIAIGVFGNIAGLWISYQLDIPSGAAIILLHAALFFISAIIRR